MESRFDKEDALRLTRTYSLPADHHIILATPTDRPHDPPPDTATERLKLRAAEIEVTKNKEVAERGLVSAGPTTEEGEGTQIVPEALAASASLSEAAGDIAPSAQVGVEGRSADEAPLATRKRRRPEQVSQPTPSDEQHSERGDEAPVISGTVSIESTPTPLSSLMAISEVPPSSPPRTMRRLRRLGDLPSSSGEPSGQATAPQEQIAISNRLAELEDELKKLKALGESRGQSTTALEKAKKLLEAERNKSSDLSGEVARLEALVKQRDKEIKTATTRKRKAIDDMNLMKVENRGLEQRVKDLDALLTIEPEGRSTDQTKSEGALKDLQAALDASRATLKE
ncbi:uncharacterized protein LOC122004558 [Zingiber officinale]|uniref:uncharacterized protein LOC122004558 n=1 Tax=Zingiber officinale TaxID=94328 RepID=UPI001C4C5CC4|nr:uncharacterized protein LOC122004558 [Zingiber officinale]